MIKVIDNYVPDSLMDYLVFLLEKSQGWRTGTKSNQESDYVGDMGMILKSMSVFEDDADTLHNSDHEILNSFASYILFSLYRDGHLNVDSAELLRVYWNRYGSFCMCDPHKDSPEEGMYSILVQLTNGGMNIFDGKELDTQKGRIVIFNSNIEHSAHTDKIDLPRYTLNMIYRG